MKSNRQDIYAASLPRRDIVAICAYLNRHSATKAVDGTISGSPVHLDKLTRAARMQ
jgi:hypothetical protein